MKAHATVRRCAPLFSGARHLKEIYSSPHPKKKTAFVCRTYILTKKQVSTDGQYLCLRHITKSGFLNTRLQWLGTPSMQWLGTSSMQWLRNYSTPTSQKMFWPGRGTAVPLAYLVYSRRLHLMVFQRYNGCILCHCYG